MQTDELQFLISRDIFKEPLIHQGVQWIMYTVFRKDIYNFLNTVYITHSQPVRNLSGDLNIKSLGLQYIL